VAIVLRRAASLRRGSPRLHDRVLLKRILVIRGGAIGDFVLTLPTIRALRIAFPQSYIEVLGYKHILELALNPLHADAARSIESATLAPFFARDADLPPQLASHFASFDLIISYLFDPDAIFAGNLARVGAKHVIHGPAKLTGNDHAAVQLAQSLHELNIEITSFAAQLPVANKKDRRIAIHPGSGSTRKNWPIERWIALAKRIGVARLVIVGGEADREQIAALKTALPQCAFAENLPLRDLAATIAGSELFVGHDSGISHIAAATGTRCVLLFGPTDPEVWAPLNENVRVLRAANGDLTNLAVDEVAQELMRIGIST
jgi:heptosyltransferase-2